MKKVNKAVWTTKISLPALKAVAKGMLLTDQLKTEITDFKPFIDQSFLPESLRIQI